MDDGEVPERRWTVGVHHHSASNGADDLIAGFRYAVLLRGVGKSVGGGDATRLVVRGKCPIKELTPAAIDGAPTIRVNMTDSAPELSLHASDPRDDGRWCCILCSERDGVAVPSGMVHDGEEVAVMVARLRARWLTEIQVDLVQGTS